jgi:hypothetical protein
VFYGTIENGIITNLNVHHPCDVIADELARLGTAFQLIVVDLWRHATVDVVNAVAVGSYLGVSEIDREPDRR